LSNELRQTPLSFGLEDITVGAEFSFEKVISEADGDAFAMLTGDLNPLHRSDDFAAARFGKRVIHGMHLASHFSTLVGMYCPGENALFVQQAINFRNPVFYGERIEVKATVLSKSMSTRLVVLKTEILRAGIVVVDGQASAMLLESKA
jgi:3-hydroxybutyryl-CoA dehydratase